MVDSVSIGYNPAFSALAVNLSKVRSKEILTVYKVCKDIARTN